MHAVDGAALQCLEKLARGDDLVRIKQFDLKLALCRLVDRVDGGFGHLFPERRPRIGLETPAYRLLGVQD